MKYQKFHGEHDGQTIVETVQDIEPYIEHAKALRNEKSDYGPQFGNEVMNQTHEIPNIVVHQLIKRGHDIYSADCDMKAVKRILNEEFPWTKTTR